MGACRRTSNRQEHKIIQRAGPEQDTIFHLHVTACRRRGSHRQDERLAWVASRGQGTSCSSSFVSKVLGANYKRANNFLPVAHKFTMCTDRKQPLNLPVMRMRVWIRHVYCGFLCLLLLAKNIVRDRPLACINTRQRVWLGRDSQCINLYGSL